MLLSLLKPEYGYYAFLLLALLTLLASIDEYFFVKREKIRDKNISNKQKKLNISLDESIQQNNNEYRRKLAQRSDVVKSLVLIYETSAYVLTLFIMLFPFVLAVYIPFVLLFTGNYFYYFVVYFAIWGAYFLLLTLYTKLKRDGIPLLTAIMAFAAYLLISILIVIIRWSIEVIW
jgi:hypothetical protein